VEVRLRPSSNGRECKVIRVLVLYSEQPDSEAYEQHAGRAREQVPGATLRHGRVLGGVPDPDAGYYAEFEFPDRDAWKAGHDGLGAVAEDAQQLGVPFRVYFTEIS
jgi:hypothetical protein